MEACLDDLFAVGATPAEPAFEFLLARGEDKDARRLGVYLVEVHLAEHVDVEQDALALLEHVFDEELGRAVVVAVHQVVFHQRVVLDHLLELFLGLEEVVHPVHLALAGTPGGSGDGVDDIGEFADDLVLEGGLARAARGAHHEKLVLHELKCSKYYIYQHLM